MRKTRLISIILSFVMAMTFTPTSLMTAMADGLKNIETDLSSDNTVNGEVGVTDIDNNYYGDSYISEELVKKRTANSKLFLLEDGTLMQQQFSVPVHYKDGEDYKEIDNTLNVVASEDDGLYYVNKANSFNVKLFDNIDNDKAISIENNNLSIDFIINDRKQEKLNQSKAILSADNTSEQISTDVAKIVGTDAVDYAELKTKEPIQPRAGETSLTYKKVFDGVDLEYFVNSLGLKENIIVNKRLPDYIFSFTVITNGLQLTLEDGGNITAYNEDGEAIFIIPAPNMTDNNGVYSEEVYYELTKNEEDNYLLSVIADTDWFNDSARAFPVKIDPIVYPIEKQNANGLTLYYGGGSSPEYNQSRIKFGKVNSSRCDSFMSFPNENDQFKLSGCQLTYSKLKYYIRSVGGNAAGKTDYTVRTARTTAPLSSITSFSQINYSDSPILLKNSIKSTKFLFFNASHEERWEEVYFNPEDFGDCPDMVFMWYYTSLNDNQHGEVDVRSGNLPSVLNYYVSTVGIREDLPYDQMKYNGGVASVNLINGALTATFNALSIDVAQNPLSLQLVYNDYYDDIMTEFGMHNMFGKNVKINFQQMLNREDKFARYVDEDGSIETLSRAISSYYSTDKSMTYMTNDNALYINTKTKVLFDGDKLYKYYDTSDIYSGKLMYEVFYSGNKITQIAGYTDNIKTHYITFTYNSDDRVSYAQSYISTSANGASFQSLARCDFTYDTDGNLTEINNYNSWHKKFVFEYYNEQLYGLIDFDGNGYMFGRTHWTNPSPMRMAGAETIYGESPEYDRCIDNSNGYTNYSASNDSKTTKVEYYNTSKKKLGERNINRRFSKGFYSEWNIDDKGETVINTSVADMTGDSGQEYLTYIKSEYTTKEKNNTSLSGDDRNSASPGDSIYGTISANHGIVSKTGRQYCLSFMLESSGSTYVEIYVSGTKKGTIGISGASAAYYIVPVSYYPQSNTTSIQIKNIGTNNIYASYVSYNYYTSVKKTKKIRTNSALNYITNTESVSYNNKQIATLDYFGRPLTVTNTDYTVSPSETTTYNYTYESGGSEFNCNKLVSIAGGTKSVEYTYSTTSSGEIQTTAITKNNNVPVSKTVTLTYGELGNYYESKTQNGITVKTEYAIKSGNVRPYKVTTGDSVTEYGYNFDGNITVTKVDGVITQQTFYDGSNGKESGFHIGGFEYYTLTRDSSLFGLVKGVNYRGIRMVTFGYNGDGDIESATYANDAMFNYAYNNRSGDLNRIEIQDSSSSPLTSVEFGYDGNDLTSIVQKLDGTTQLSYLFSETENQYQTTVEGDINASFSYKYNEETGLITNRIISFENDAYSRIEFFNFDGRGILKKLGSLEFKTTYSHDAYDRVNSQTYYVEGANRQILNYEYDTIVDSGFTYQTNRIKKITNTSTNEYQTYSYNDKGYVRSYYNSQNSDNYTYNYDSAGRLTSDGVYTYAYDTYNNILSKQSGVNSTTYTYDNIKRTRLNSVTENGTKKYFEYDAIGNMTTYKGAAQNSSQNLYWTRGNMLASGNIKNNKSFSYKYDPSNLRYSKTVNGVETLYYWDDGVLLGERTGDNFIQYIYDANGIAGMKYNNSYYYFEKNLFGDIIRAYSSAGTVVAKFRYDSYGNIISSSGSMADKVKFRYRGYYYDDETGFYYLQSRYYDPSLCRFISADQYELVDVLSQTLGQLNLYAYCNNNPIMYTDESGESFILSLFIAIACGGIIGGVTGALGALMAGENWIGAFGSGFLIGGVLGAAAFLGGATALTIGGKVVEGFFAATTFAGKTALLASMAGGTALASFGAGVGAYAIEQHANGRNFEWNGAILNGFNTTVKGLTAFGIGMVMASVGAYNYLLKGAVKQTITQKIVGGIERGIVSNIVKVVYTPWYFAY